MTDSTAIPAPRLHRRGLLYEIIETLVFVVAVFALVEIVAPRFMVEGPSMQPNFYDYQRLIVNRLNYMVGDIQRGDIVVFNPPGSRDDDPPLIKRAIGLPGETIELRDGEVYIDGVLFPEGYTNGPCTIASCADNTWVLQENEYFFMGDNRNRSRDSRVFGPVEHGRVIGEAVLRYWPPADFAIVDSLAFPTR